MEAKQSWRDLLDIIIQAPHERQRLASALGVSPITLTRWANKECTPRLQNLRNLLENSPQYREQLRILMQEEFSELSYGFAMDNAQESRTLSTISSEFYSRVLRTKSYTTRQLRFSTLCDLILQQALDQLDPRGTGMAIVVTRCMRPSADEKVRSLRESYGRGTKPWADNLEPLGIFLGAESLAGHAIISGHLEVNQRLSVEHNISPGYRGRWEESAAAVPILDAGAIAGSLLVSSTQSDYFSPARCALIEQFADLVALALFSDDFYATENIELSIMPQAEVQQPYLLSFRQRVNALMKDAVKRGRPLTILQAEYIVWGQLEEELLRVSHV